MPTLRVKKLRLIQRLTCPRSHNQRVTARFKPRLSGFPRLCTEGKLPPRPRSQPCLQVSTDRALELDEWGGTLRVGATGCRAPPSTFLTSAWDRPTPGSGTWRGRGAREVGDAEHSPARPLAGCLP